MRKIIFLIMAAVSLSFASYDVFPVPQRLGREYRIVNNINYGDGGLSHQHIFDSRVFINKVEISITSFGIENNIDRKNESKEDNFGILDMAFGFKYQAMPFFAVAFDLNILNLGPEYMDSRFWKIAAQYSTKIGSMLMIGSEIGFRNPFSREYTQEYYDYYGGSLEEGTTTVDQGGILNVKGEIDFSATQRFILFLAADWEIQLNDTDFDSDLYYGSSWSSGAGDGLLQLNLGFSYAFSYSFSIEESNFFRFGILRDSRLGHSVVLKWSL